MTAIEQLVDFFVRSRSPVVFTGAGVSTESGIPDFRSPGGIWDRYAPIDFREFLADPRARRETWRRGRHTYPVVVAASPNPAHLALAQLERLGKLSALITQNVDGLHLRAGSSPERIIELHGNAHSVRCLDCAALFPRAEVHRRVEAGEEEPRCAQCGGTLKPTTVSFGESMPLTEVRRAEEAARSSDLFIVVGSSLVVYPAAGLPEIALRSGATLAIINASPTHLDALASVHSDQKAGEILPEVVRRVEDRLGSRR